MHALPVTYGNDASPEEVQAHPDNIGFAQELKGVPGLISKTWIYDDKIRLIATSRSDTSRCWPI